MGNVGTEIGGAQNFEKLTKAEVSSAVPNRSSGSAETSTKAKVLRPILSACYPSRLQLFFFEKENHKNLLR